MKNEQIVNRFQLVFLAVTIILLFLCLTWSPAYGYSLARIDNITVKTIETDNSLGSQGTGLSLAASAPGLGMPADRPVWSAEQPFAYNTYDEVPNDCPPPSVPEPATLMLLGIGLAGVSICRKMRK